MRKITTITLALTVSMIVGAQTQIGNSGFEDWESVPGGFEPVNWNSFLTVDGSFNSFAKAVQIAEDSDVRPGSSSTKSVKIYSRKVPIVSVIANGNLTLGRIHAGGLSANDPKNNYNRSVTGDTGFSEVLTEKPDSLVFWVKFTPNGHSENARVSAVIHGDTTYQDPQVGASSYVVGKAQLNFPSTAGQWVRKSVPFNYTGPSADARYILVTFTTNEAPGKGKEGDIVWIDDVELVYVPKPAFTVSAATICEGGTVNFTNTSGHYPTSYSWSFPGGSPSTSTAANPSVTYSTSGTYNVVLTATNHWGSKTQTFTNHIAVNQFPDASFDYGQSSFCTNEVNPTPSVSNSGTFSTVPSGLTFASTSTGEINLSSSTAGTYDIIHTTLGLCPSTDTVSITINQGANANFNYLTNSICLLSGNQTPSVSEAGTFSATPVGLTFVSTSTGEIDVNGSTAGTYSIQHAVGGICPHVVTKSITLTDAPDASFTYSQAEFCANGTDPAPVFGSGANGGVFSSTTGLIIDANTGVVDLSASTPGSYKVENLLAATGGCSASVADFDIEIHALPTVNFVVTDDTICTILPSFSLSGGTPAGGVYSGSGVTSGVFDPLSVALGSTSVLTYTYTDPTTLCSNSAVAHITVDACLSVDANEMELISVYPNPTNGTLVIANIKEITQYTIISVTGQEVVNGELTISSNKIDISSVQNGVYLLQLQQGQNIHTIRIVKQ